MHEDVMNETCGCMLCSKYRRVTCLHKHLQTLLPDKFFWLIVIKKQHLGTSVYENRPTEHNTENYVHSPVKPKDC